MNQTAIETTKDIATLNIEMEKQGEVSNTMTFTHIRDIVLQYYKLSWIKVWDSGRLQENVLARSVIFYFMRELTPACYRQIGAYFNGMKNKPLDHSTVMNGIDKIKERLSYDKKFQKEIAFIRSEITSKTE